MMLAVMDLLAAQGDVRGAVRAFKTAQAAAPDDPAVQAAAERIEGIGNWVEWDDAARQRKANKVKKQRARALTPDAGVAEALAEFTAAELKKVLRGLGATPTETSRPKADLLRQLEGALADEQRLKRAATKLSPNAARAAAHVLRLGGWADEAMIAREHDRPNRPPLPPEAPPVFSAPAHEEPGVLDELVASGLAVRAAVLGVPALLVPAPARKPLARVLA
jgi:hypothetical protein